MKSNETFTLIQEITELNGDKYIEIGNMKLNGLAELAAEQNLIKSVRIIQLNISHSQHVQKYEEYINEQYEIPAELPEKLDSFERWQRDEEAKKEFKLILHENHIKA